MQKMLFWTGLEELDQFQGLEDRHSLLLVLASLY